MAHLNESLMPLFSDLLTARMGLPPARHRDILVERDLQVRMPDGAVLLADRYVAKGADPMPTVLVRSPYGRRGMFGLLYGRLYAERGLQVVMQSTRGTFGSEGDFSPFDEREDGLATIAWVQEQPWHDGKIGMAGASYLGQVQWAVAGEAGDALGALAPTVTASQFHGASYGGGLSLESSLSWTFSMAVQEDPLAPLKLLLIMLRLKELVDHLPLGDIDTQILGKPHHLHQRAFEHTEPDDPYWIQRDFTSRLADVAAPVQLVAGWFDMFTPWQLADYIELREAGREVQLIVGPWAHTSDGLFATSTRESIGWMRAHLLGDRSMISDERVRIHVGGIDEWRALPDWPPPAARPWRLHLQPGGALAPDAPAPSEPDRYRYDPSDPTPSLGGPVLLVRKPVLDNFKLERRDDVLTYTTPPLAAPVEAIGPVEAEIFVRSSVEHFDVFVRVCDVTPRGVSRNVCDGIRRVAPGDFERGEDGVLCVRFGLWPTAHHFAAGHRIRIQVSSGAHPRFARNLGTGEPLGTGTRMVVADQEIWHDPAHRSGVVLSVVD